MSDALSPTEICNAVTAATEKHAETIKNRGKLNPKFCYFQLLETPLTPHTKLSNTLSDEAQPKFFTVASDMIFFNSTLKYALMIFRCPHDKSAGKTCQDNILDTTSFQYKGCLATPGGFFEVTTDVKGTVPDFLQTATREFNEECSKTLSGNFPHTSIRFHNAKFNNFRDIRWKTSSNYVPTCAAQFSSILKDTPVRSSLPSVRGSDDACGIAKWVDMDILHSVYRKYKDVFESFDSPSFSDERFDAFLNGYFVLDSNGSPRNKLVSENSLLAQVPPSQTVIPFVSGKEYSFSDFAFDHVKNIIDAWHAYQTLIKEKVLVFDPERGVISEAEISPEVAEVEPDKEVHVNFCGTCRLM